MAVWFVAPNGRPTGRGTIDDPWDLQTALNGGPNGEVQPGDTILVRGGEYEGPFYCSLQGTEENPITVRAFPTETPILQVYFEYPGYEPRPPAILILDNPNCKFVRFWGFILRNHGIRTRRGDITGRGMQGILLGGASNVEIINFIIHDVVGVGGGIWSTSPNIKVYGTLVFNNGWISPARRNGHCFYTQNSEGWKVYIDNLCLNPFDKSIAVYGSENAIIKHFYLEGNVFANRMAVFGGYEDTPVEDIKIKNCFFWNAHPDLGYNSYYFIEDLLFEGNIVARTEGITATVARWKRITFRKNKVVNLQNNGGTLIHLDIGLNGLTDYYFNENVYHYAALGINAFPFKVTRFQNYPPLTDVSWEYPQGEGIPTWRPTNSPGGSLGLDYPNSVFLGRPSGVEIYIRPNQYEHGRAHVIIFNWDNRPTVSVDLSSILPLGIPFEIRNAFDFFNDVVASGVYDGQPIIIDMVNRSVAKPVGWDEILGNPFPTFGVFVVLPQYPLLGFEILNVTFPRIVNQIKFKITDSTERAPYRLMLRLKRNGEVVYEKRLENLPSLRQLWCPIHFSVPSGTYEAEFEIQDKYGISRTTRETINYIRRRRVNPAYASQMKFVSMKAEILNKFFPKVYNKLKFKFSGLEENVPYTITLRLKRNNELVYEKVLSGVSPNTELSHLIHYSVPTGIYTAEFEIRDRYDISVVNRKTINYIRKRRVIKAIHSRFDISIQRLGPTDVVIKIPYRSGLNLTSIPVTTTNTWQQILSIPSSKLYAATWDENTQQYVYATSETAPPSGQVGSLAQAPRYGYGHWIKLDESRLAVVRGKLDQIEKSVTIALAEGWNLIGNPHLRHHRWNPWSKQTIYVVRNNEEKTLHDAHLAGWVDCCMWKWIPKQQRGSYALVFNEFLIPKTVSLIRATEAYWIKAKTACSLVFMPPSYSDNPPAPPQPNYPGFALCIYPQINDTRGVRTYVGILRGLSMEIEHPPSPPFIADFPIKVSVIKGDKKLGVDIRNTLASEISWSLLVEWIPFDRHSRIDIDFEGMRFIPENYDLYLVDELTGKSILIDELSTYTFIASPNETNRRLTLILRRKRKYWWLWVWNLEGR